MACKPDLIVFDEPTTALDVTTQIEVLAAIKDAIRELNTAAIYISHDLAVVAQVSDRIMVLRYGEAVEVGKTREMIAAPREEYTRDLLSVPQGARGEGASSRGGRDPAPGQGHQRELRRLRWRAGARRHHARPHPLQHHRGSRRVGERQEHPGACHHRAPAPDQGFRHIRGPSAAAAFQAPRQGDAAPPADDLSDAGRGPEPAPEGARGARPAPVLLLRHGGQGATRPGGGAPRSDRAE